MKMRIEQTKIDLATARAFKKHLQEALERDSRGKAHSRSVDKRGAYATPKARKGDDVFGMLVNSLRNSSNRHLCADYDTGWMVLRVHLLRALLQAESSASRPSRQPRYRNLPSRMR